ncbi:aspartate kinase [Terriglobus roseus DSM 18391]|uniref:Aspartokinase n=1 Tax=Terriglobus roseus (strain DSM 18391 / NRRL B-41598 / KBS 63) TaxID=926566 RepID=I3ZGZ8_TERRK|nr:lysine-sensitive aspartokinase 3 [Terriglobus roseus]AFL88516.1 aspartate kinase [Terriglobus roseus DSM 18391]AFL88856.1 aspartate kinase [Terriglobus roseus DSM 18391]
MSEGSSAGDQRKSTNSESPIVVMKFGGTSVQDAAAIKRTISIVKGRRDRGQRPVVVVSALAKVTDQLLLAAEAAANNQVDEAMALCRALRVRHLHTAVELVGRNIHAVAKVIDENLNKLEDILRGVAAVGELTKRTTDLISSYGERLSSRIVADAFEHRGISSAHVDARTCIITNSHHGRAVPQPELIEAKLLEHVLPLLDVGAIPIMGGFIGATTGGITTTLGRGGSDFTAALVGSGLNAEGIEIWTDVNGIMTTDPRICPDALRVRTISFEEAAELAYFGAKVLHPSTILPAVKKDIPVWVLNSHDSSNEGTKITASAPRSTSPLKSISAKKHLTIIHIVSSRMLMSHGFLRASFEVLDRYACAVNMVSTSEVSISVSIDATDDLPAIIADLSEIAAVRTEEGKALICLVGDNIQGHKGLSEQVFSAVREINLDMISQGANGINMSFMIDGAAVESAVRSLHRQFFSNPDPAVFDLGHTDGAIALNASMHPTAASLNSTASLALTGVL